MKVAIYRTRVFRGVNARLEISYHKLSASLFLFTLTNQ
jgi:hypothetical protein